jgi:hypothetical protein
MISGMHVDCGFNYKNCATDEGGMYWQTMKYGLPFDGEIAALISE